MKSLGPDASGDLPPEVVQATANALASIGVRIREARAARLMTLQSLADATGLSVSMISLVERGRASPSIGSLVVIAGALGVAMSDLVAADPASEDQLIIRNGEAAQVTEAGHVVRRLLREDRARGVSIAVNEYEPHTGAVDRPVSHPGHEYGFVLEGRLTVEIDGTTYIVNSGDLISYSSKRRHRIWNHGRKRVRTIWINVKAD